jgi:hypothetical protein
MTMRLLAALLVAGLALAAKAGPDGAQLSLRLVEASNSGRGSPPALNDVSGILKGSLGFDSCTFLASGWVRLPADRQTRTLAEYAVTCSGPQAKLSIAVRRGGKPVLKTTVSLQDGKPLLVGGFPAAAGKHVLVFLVQ